MNIPVREGETIEGSRTMRNRPYPVLKCSRDDDDDTVHTTTPRTTERCERREVIEARRAPSFFHVAANPARAGETFVPSPCSLQSVAPTRCRRRRILIGSIVGSLASLALIVVAAPAAPLSLVKRSAAFASIYWGFESTHSSLSGIDIANLSLCTLFYNGTDADQAYLADQIVANARYEAGLPPLAPGEAMAHGGKFFTIVHERFVCGGDEKMAYRNVWKGGNNFIRGNMQEGMENCTAASKGLSVNVDKAFEFSFVRDPFSHFVSGYREATMRTYKQCCNAPTQEGALPTPRGEWPRPIRESQELGWRCRYDCSLFVGEGTKSLAKAVMSDILDLSLFHGSHWNPNFVHVALMFANIFGERSWRRPDFIGRLESIGSDWDRMCALHGCPERLATYGKLDESTGQHKETSSDQ